MVGYGENVKEDESIMGVVVLFPVIVWLSEWFFKKVGWKVTNYLGDEIPYNLGFGLLVALYFFSFLFGHIIFIIYLTLLWVTGIVDDCFGTKYPKGLKGHVRFFLATGNMTTGLLKLLCTVSIAFVITIWIEGGFLEKTLSFLLLILPPHIMNLFDTRPLRVWKVLILHCLLFYPYFFFIPNEIFLPFFVIVATLVYFEGSRRGMLGDNGATLLGGLVGVLSVLFLSITAQLSLVAFYVLMIIVTEKISISQYIEKRPLLKKIDQWGVS